jgi:hypothetical protein
MTLAQHAIESRDVHNLRLIQQAEEILEWGDRLHASEKAWAQSRIASSCSPTIEVGSVKRLNTLLDLPNFCGKSLQVAPVLLIHNIPSTNFLHSGLVFDIHTGIGAQKLQKPLRFSCR